MEVNFSVFSGDLQDIKSFYNGRNYGFAHQVGEKIIVAEKDGKIIGVVRLCQENSLSLLRGMQVLPEFQKQGIGTKLLVKFAEILGSNTCYCLPYEHLEKFYSQIGFRKIADSEAPQFLQQRVAEYRAKPGGKRYIIMMR